MQFAELRTYLRYPFLILHLEEHFETMNIKYLYVYQMLKASETLPDWYVSLLAFLNGFNNVISGSC